MIGVRWTHTLVPFMIRSTTSSLAALHWRPARQRVALAHRAILLGLTLFVGEFLGAQVPTHAAARAGVVAGARELTRASPAHRPPSEPVSCVGPRSKRVILWTAAGVALGWGVFLARGGLVDTVGGEAYRQERNSHLATGAVLGAAFGLWRASRAVCALGSGTHAT